VLTFVASSIAYIFNPEWAQNRWFVLITIWVMLWLATFLNFRGMRLSAWLSSSGALAGTLIPGAAIILLALGYLCAGKTPQITFSAGALIPELGNWNQLMLLSGMMVALAGMEMSAIHVTEMKNPGRDFPRAIFRACFLVILLSVLGALAIALVIPPAEISLAAGADQAFAAMFKIFHIPWMTPIMCLLLSYGALTMVVTWVLGPSKGVLEVAKEGFLPRCWQHRNKDRMPTVILIIQAVISSLLALVVLFMPTISGAFWLMSALTAQLYMVMYLLMFAAAIKLRYSKPEIPRKYQVPGGKPGMWIVSGIAFLTSLFAIITGFIPTPAVRAKGALHIVAYIAFLLIGTVIFILIPLWFYKRSQKTPPEP
jgi:amino acid transporter